MTADEGSEHQSEEDNKTQSGNQLYQDLFQDTIERVARLDSDAQFLSVNKQFADLFGYHSSEMIGMSLSELCHPDECSKILDLYVEMKSTNRSEGLIKAVRHAGDDFYLRMLLIKGIEKAGSSYFCYCIVDLVSPDERHQEDKVYTEKTLDLGLPFLSGMDLQQREEKIRNLIDGLNAVFWECSYPDFKYTFISRSITQILGISANEWHGTSKFNPDFIHPEDIEQVLESSLFSVKQGKDFELSYRIKNDHNQYVWLQDFISIVHDQNQKAYQLRGVTVDISSSKMSEQIAINSRTRFFNIFDTLPNAVFQIRLNDGIITRINPAFTELTGFSREDIIGRTSSEINFMTDDVSQRLSEEIKNNGRLTEIDVQFSTVQGQASTMCLSSILVIEEKTSYMFSIVSSVGETASISSESNFEREKTHLVMDLMSENIAYLDTEYRLKFINDNYNKIFNPENKEIVGKKLSEIIGQEQFDKISGYLSAALDGEQVNFEHLDTDLIPGHFFELSLIPNNVEDDSVQGIFLLSNDITEKKLSKIKEIQLGEILEKSLSEFYILDIESSQFQYANRGARKNTGYSLDELKYQHYSDITPDLDQTSLQKFIADLSTKVTEVISLSTRIKRKDGTYYSADINIQLSDINGKKELVFWVKDMSQQEYAEEQIQRSEKILSSTNDSIIFIDVDFNIQYINKVFLETFGYQKEYILNKNLREIWGEQLFYTSMEQQLEQAFSGRSKQDQLWIPLPAGERRLSIQYSPNFTRDTVISGVVISMRDITELEITKHALSENEERFRLISMATNDALYDWDLDNIKVWRNDKDFANLSSGNELKDWKQNIHPEDRDKVYQSYKDTVNKKEKYWTAEYRTIQIDGSYISVFDRAYILYDDRQKPVRIMGAMTDITDRKKVEQALISSEERYRALYQDNPLMLFSVDSNGVILSLNNNVTDNLGYRETDILGETIYSMIADEFIEIITDAINNTLTNVDTIQKVELQKKHKTGGNIWVRYTIRSINDPLDEKPRVLIVCEDISENKRLSEQLSYQASHDSLTGLVNRAEFERRLERVLNSLEDESAHHALCYLDLDQFKIVNDTCGHIAGDELLRQISGILSNAVRKRDTLARLGGDEFGILMEHCTLEQAQRVANEMRKYIEDFRYIWEGKRFVLGVSIGLVPIQPGGNKNIHAIMREADVACYAAKDAGRNRVHIYTPDDGDLSGKQGQVQWAAIINQALDEERFSLFHQSIETISPFNAQSNGERFEILLRMQDEKDGLINPEAFMTAAERYNLAVKIDTWVFGHVLEWMSENSARIDNLKMCAINISGHSIDNIQYLDFVLQKLYETNIPPEKICFEITETAAISNISTALTLMQTIKSVGCKFALDDFGSGVSSFAYLKQLPVDYLKIDGTFVRDIVDDQIYYEMVRSIKDVAGVMGMKTIAEFVESEDIQNKLLEIGIDYGQGYFIAEPKPLK